MKRRLFALLAVPFLALGFAFASPSTDQAQAYPYINGYEIACTYAGGMMARAEYYEDWASYDHWYDQAEGLGCIA